MALAVVLIAWCCRGSPAPVVPDRRRPRTAWTPSARRRLPRCGSPGLWCYTFVLTGSIPGLTPGAGPDGERRRQCGLEPGPRSAARLGLAVTFGILRSWGFPPATVALSALVPGIWNVLAKLALPLLGLLGLLRRPGRRDRAGSSSASPWPPSCWRVALDAAGRRAVQRADRGRRRPWRPGGRRAGRSGCCASGAHCTGTAPSAVAAPRDRPACGRAARRLTLGLAGFLGRRPPARI